MPLFSLSAVLANKLKMLEGVNNYYSDANDLQNVYGRIAGIPAINNVPMINNIISGYIFDFSAHPYRNFQIYFHLNEKYKIFIRTRNNQGFSNWEQIYPDYSSKSLTVTGYIIFNNGLILQWLYISSIDGESAGIFKWEENNSTHEPYCKIIYPITLPNNLLNITTIFTENTSNIGVPAYYSTITSNQIYCKRLNASTEKVTVAKAKFKAFIIGF